MIMIHPGIMARGQILETQGPHLVEERPELDGPVAVHAGVRGPPPQILGDEGTNDLLLQITGKIKNIMADSELLADPPGVLDLLGTAALDRSLFRRGDAQAHGDADDLMSVFFKKPGRDGGIDAAAHGYGHLFAHALSRCFFK